MAETKTRRKQGPVVNKKTLRYFYLNDDLHKALHVNRSIDVITAWNYPKGRQMAYTYSDVKKRAEKAFTTVEVGRMVNRTRLTLQHGIINNQINPPQMTYGLNEHRRPFKYMWAEKDIMELHAFLCTQHKGKPRKDGLITPMKLPSARELRAMIRQETVLYVKTDDGDFVPTWKAENF